jgi:hypothetical protein
MVVSTWVYTPPMRCDAPREELGPGGDGRAVVVVLVQRDQWRR